MWMGMHGEVDRLLLRRAALRYAGHGWDVLPGAYLARDRFYCGPGCRTVACHPARTEWIELASHEPEVVARWWSGHRPYSVLLATGHAFDVLEVCGYPGPAAAQAAPRGPAAVTPAGRWMMLIRPGSTLRPELARRPDTVLHGPRSWIPAPTTRTPAGRVRWLVAPMAVDWQLPDPEAVQDSLVDLLARVHRRLGPPRLPATGRRCGR
jgi:hypothetical protein